MQTGLSSVEKIYSVCGILENAETCLYGYKTDDVFETNPIPCILLLSKDENLNIQVSWSVIKLYPSSHEKGFWNSWFRSFSEIMVKIGEEY